ncbi:uncharacterized protein FRV6_16474 [Fusarium oxysporum]|uniref:Uncharacterized protein n=1 Tax=Fusarium oxysporum TaxID=5507 RepID=A0A2H3UAM8_FUSOX|nr:uncharacterized protein FRV6_16474 [Fusarium oxysporum]
MFSDHTDKIGDIASDGPGMEAPGALQKEIDSGFSDSKNQSSDKPGDDAKPDEAKPTTSRHEKKQQIADASSKQNLLPSTLPKPNKR